jgi:uncharacterized protein YjbJ (UPF0337 family)
MEGRSERRHNLGVGGKMNWDQVEGSWKEYKGKAREKWGKLTDDDLDVVNGKRDQLVGRIQHHYGIAKEIAERQIDEFLSGFVKTPTDHHKKASIIN